MYIPLEKCWVQPCKNKLTCVLVVSVYFDNDVYYHYYCDEHKKTIHSDIESRESSIGSSFGFEVISIEDFFVRITHEE